MNVTVVVPTIPGREQLLTRALSSIHYQTHPATAIIVERDPGRTGAAATRMRAMDRVTTEWTAFLDDDDEMLPNHLHVLADAGAATAADYVFADWRVPEVPDFTLPGFCYGPFDPADPLQTTITFLARTELVRGLGLVWPPEPMTVRGCEVGEDHWFTIRAAAAGYRIHHEPEVTWLWHHHGQNTAGRAA